MERSPRFETPRKKQPQAGHRKNSFTLIDQLGEQIAQAERTKNVPTSADSVSGNASTSPDQEDSSELSLLYKVNYEYGSEW